MASNYDSERHRHHPADEFTYYRLRQLVGVRDVLEELDNLIHDGQSAAASRVSNLERLGTPDGPLTKLKAELDDIKAKLEPKMGWKEKMKWPLKEGDMKKSFEHLKNIRELVEFALHADHM